MGDVRKGKLQLSRIVPEHVEVFTFLEIGIDWATMTLEWRAMRSTMDDPLDSCFWCEHKFEDGEKMSLGISSAGNKMLCRKCVDLVEEQK